MGPFSILGLPDSLVIDAESLESRFRKLSKKAHPDGGGSEEEFERLGAAYEVLKWPASRLRAALEAEVERGSVSGEVMDFFGPVAEVIQEVDLFLAEREKARSGLGKAVLDARIPPLKQTLENISGELRSLEEALVARFEEFDARGWESCQGEMEEVARGLVFLEKWQSQLKGAIGKLFEALLGGMS